MRFAIESAGIGALVAVLVFDSVLLSAQERNVLECPPSPPSFQQLRYEEDYRYLEDARCRRDLTDAIRHVPMGSRPFWFLTFGGEVRQQFEYFGAALTGPSGDDGYSLQRYMVHANARFGRRLRVFGQLASAVEWGRTGGPRPIDEDVSDVHQAFVDINFSLRRHESTLRIGRQEMAFGSQRLISYQEGTNVRSPFDGVRLATRVRGWTLDALALRPVSIRAGTFDDTADGSRALWGAYATRRLQIPGRANIDVYYLGVRRGRARFDQGPSQELRHSLGARLWERVSRLDYNAEFVAQFGSYGAGSIRAWALASDVGYTFKRARLQPRLGLKLNAYSGDKDRSDKDLQTYNALFPTGAYFGFDGLFGPYNLYDVHPSIRLHFSRGLSIIAETDLFWRQRLDDGLYSNSGALQRSGLDSPDRHIGGKHQLWGERQISRSTYVVVNYSYFRHGRFLRTSQPAITAWHYVTAWITYRF